MNNSNEKEIESVKVDNLNEVETTTTEVKTEETTPTTAVKVEDEVVLENLDIDFAYDLMSVPTVSSEEYRMVTYIVLWARRNNIKYEFDAYGNLYLTKGELEEGEFYPCVTSHLDTVQQKQRAYAQAGVPLEIKGRICNKKHEIFVDGMGIGADCKTGILISLSLFEHFDKLKAAFFLEEEIGMKGSEHLDVAWFDNVGYVIGWDSPELNRAAWSCSGTILMSKDFFQDHLKPICDKHGLTKFHAEPFTDVKYIREKTGVMCMNFGNGGYAAHSATEYMVLEDTDHALTMGIDIIKGLGCNRFYLKHKTTSSAWIRQADGTYKKPEEDTDAEFFRKLDSSSYGGYSGGNYGGSAGYYDDDEWNDYWGGSYGRHCGSTSGSTHTSSSATKPTTTTTSTTKPSQKEDEKKTVSDETVMYISEKYEERIAEIKSDIEKRCTELGVDFDSFKDVFEKNITF